MSWIEWLAGLTADESEFARRVERILGRAEGLTERLYTAPGDSLDAYHCREYLEALHAELCELHGYRPASSQGGLFWDVIFNGEEYEYVIRKIMNAKKLN